MLDVNSLKGNLKKKITLLSILLLVLIASLIVSYLAKNKQEGVKAWYSSSWDFRRSISASNDSGGDLTNEDILVTIDTAALISSGKLQSDCDDLRFIDSDNSTALSYWVEGGCNTTTTQIWVRIPSLPSAGKTIYVYYGNATAANAEESWTGNFIALSDQTTCATGWTRISALDSKFPRGATTYGGTGGASTHSHSTTGYTNSSGGTTTVQGGATWGSTASQNGAHTHSVTANSTSNVDHTPPYVNMLYCGKNKLDIPTNHIAFFDVASFTGWTRYVALDGKFPRGASASIGDTGGSESHSHTVTFSLGTAGGSKYIGTACSSNCHYPIVSNHSHTVSAMTTTETGNNIPAYLDMVFMKKDSSGTLSTERPIYIIDTATIPLGWERFSTLDDKFPRGASSYGGTGGSDTHEHTGHKNSGGVSTLSALWYDSGNFNGTTAHTHVVYFTAASTSNLPPYTSVVYAKRKASQTTSVNYTSPTAPTSLLTEGATNPTAVTDITPEFSAIFNDSDTGDTGKYYEIEVNTASDFTGTVMWDSGKTGMTDTDVGVRSPDISYAGTVLTQEGDTYYWRIKFWDSADAVSPWSATANFTMNIANASPTAPTSLLTEEATNPTKVTDLTPEFSAIFNDPDTGDTGIHYEIEVNTATDFSGTVMWDSGQLGMTPTAIGARSPDISYAGTTLSQNGTKYYWRIRFADNHGAVSPWATANFIMSGSPIASSLLTDNQTNPSIITSATPYFSAIYTDPNSDDCSAYEINVNAVNTFDGTIMWNTGKVSTTIISGNRSSNITYTGTPLINSSSIYYWRIRFWDTDDNMGDWSSTAQFTDFYPSFKFESLKLEGLQIN